MTFFLSKMDRGDIFGRSLDKFVSFSPFLDIKIYVRRGGPNYQEGLERMRELAENLNLHIEEGFYVLMFFDFCFLFF